MVVAVGEGSKYDATNKDMNNIPHDVCIEKSSILIGSIFKAVYQTIFLKL